MKQILFVILLAFGWKAAFAQDGYVNIQADGRIDQLLSLYSEHHNSFTEKEGFRVQILATTMRDKAYDAQKDFRWKYGAHQTYLTFKSPYFKLRVGDFTDKLEAYRFLQTVKSKYPGSFLVNETVKLF